MHEEMCIEWVEKHSVFLPYGELGGGGLKPGWYELDDDGYEISGPYETEKELTDYLWDNKVLGGVADQIADMADRAMDSMNER